MADSVRIITVEYEMLRPVSSLDFHQSQLFKDRSASLVPVIRVFGRTADSTSCCVHVHRVLPYLCVPLLECGSSGAAETAALQLGASLDRSLALCASATGRQGAGHSSKSAPVYVHSVVAVMGRSMYGYHDNDSLFLKVYLFDPRLVAKAAELLQSGVVLHRSFQPYEAHVPYIQQFFIDFNLFGMNYLRMDKCTVRQHTSGFEGQCPGSEAVTTCRLEVDVDAADISNRKLLGEFAMVQNPGLDEIWSRERERNQQSQFERTIIPDDLATLRSSQKQVLPDEAAMLAKLGHQLNSVSAEAPSSCDFLDRFPPASWPVLVDEWHPPSAHPSSLEVLSPEAVVSSNQKTLAEADISSDFVCSAEPDLDHILLTQLSQQSATSNVSMDLSLEGALLDLIGEGGGGDSDYLSPELLQRDEEEELEMSQVIDSQTEGAAEERDPGAERVPEEDTCGLSEERAENRTSLERRTSTSSAEQHSSSSDLFTFDGSRDEKESALNDESTSSHHQHSNKRHVIGAPGSAADRGDVWAEFPHPPSIPPSELLNQSSSREQTSSFSSCGLQHWRALAVVSALTARGRDCAIEPVLTALSEAPSVGGHLYWRTRCRHVSLLSLPPSPRDVRDWLTARRKQRQQRRDCRKYNEDALRCSPVSSDGCEGGDGDDDGRSSSDSSQSLDLDSIEQDGQGSLIVKKDDHDLIPSSTSTTPFIAASASTNFLSSTPLTCRQRRVRRSFRRNVITVSSSLSTQAATNSDSIVHTSPTPGAVGSSPVTPSSKPFGISVSESVEPVESQSECLLDVTTGVGNSIGESPITPSLARTPLGLHMKSPANLTVKYGFDPGSQASQDLHLSQQHRSVTLMCVEVLALNRDRLCPDPQHDSIVAIFFSVINHMPRPVQSSASASGCVATSAPLHYTPAPGFGSDWRLTVVSSELELLDMLVVLVRQFDPDIISGWEIERQSLSFLFERAAVLSHCVASALSRVPRVSPAVPPVGGHSASREQSDRPGGKRVFPGSPPWLRGGQVFVSGRIVLNLWRVVKDEVALYNYSLENVVFHVLKRCTPHYEPHTLTRWWTSDQPFLRWRVMDYFRERCQMCLDVLGRLDLIARTAELARIFGIQFLEVLTRGTQFRVESMMLRLARQRHLVAVSPSIQQRATARAPECIPLVMEPDSRYYDDPVVVLDFQSLYPSIIIAYNYCFTTCLGRVEQLGQSSAFPFGCTWLDVPAAVTTRLLSLQRVHVAPCGVCFVTRQQRPGLLPDMLSDILATRVMVKAAMKRESADSPMWQQLNFKQLGLKLIANVTYGYTSANFSGRMPCIEVGDSVVSKGRETLERAIRTIESNPDWRAKVVYGDTDSLFILLKGRSRSEAFRLGKEMVDVITADNPPPVKLKFEKVFQPCILQTKKRYVGFMYESEEQKKPVFDAKGIETVRRDGCPFVARTLERSLRVLFESGSMESVRRYVSRQLWRLQCGKQPVTDLVFAREFRGRSGYRPRARLPALLIANRLSMADARSEPLAGSRVPYLVVYGAPGSPLLQLVRTPAELAADPQLRLNIDYYITRALSPALSRCFALVSSSPAADPLLWWKQLPRTPAPAAGTASLSAATSCMHRFVSVAVCCVCNAAAAAVVKGSALCQRCRERPQSALYRVINSLRVSQRAVCRLGEVCAACIGGSLGQQHDDVTHSDGRSLISMMPECENLLCPIYWRTLSAAVRLKQSQEQYHRASASLQ